MDGAEDLAAVSAGKVGASNAAAEEGVAGDERVEGRRVEADAALGVAGSVEDVKFGGADEERIAVFGRSVDCDGFGFCHAEPRGLNGEHGLKFDIVEVHVDGGAGRSFEFLRAADVIDVGVGDDDGFDCQRVLTEDVEDPGDVVAGVDDHGFARLLIAEDGAIALERAHRQDLVDHSYTLL